jgi:hypothetical protein
MMIFSSTANCAAKEKAAASASALAAAAASNAPGPIEEVYY